MTSPVGRVGGVVIAVPDPDTTAEFLSDALGFEARRQPLGWDVVCDGDYGPWGQVAVELRSAERTALVELVLEVPADYDLDGLANRATTSGAELVADDGPGLAIEEPTGLTFRAVPGEQRRTEKPQPNELRPRRLGHVNLKTPDPPAAAAFWQDVLGLSLSEQIGDRLYFLRIGSEHHNVALRPGAVSELHHLGLEIGGWQQYQPILDRLAALGHQVEYGPGRHTPGNNTFTYLCDPSCGVRLELFADMAQIPDASAHEPKRWDLDDRFRQTLNRWGPLPPESFLE